MQGDQGTSSMSLGPRSTESTWTVEADTGTHTMEIDDYNLVKNILPVGNSRSNIFNVGGFNWPLLGRDWHVWRLAAAGVASDSKNQRRRTWGGGRRRLGWRAAAAGVAADLGWRPAAAGVAAESSEPRARLNHGAQQHNASIGPGPQWTDDDWALATQNPPL
jgi:hypothetical protein